MKTGKKLLKKVFLKVKYVVLKVKVKVRYKWELARPRSTDLNGKPKSTRVSNKWILRIPVLKLPGSILRKVRKKNLLY